MGSRRVEMLVLLCAIAGCSGGDDAPKDGAADGVRPAGQDLAPTAPPDAGGDSSGDAAPPAPLLVYVQGGPMGDRIRIFSANLDTGGLTDKGSVAGPKNPIYLTVDRVARRLFAIGDAEDVVEAFTIDSMTGALRSLGRETTGRTPVYVSVDREGKLLLTGHYGGASTSIFSIGADGRPRALGAAAGTGERTHSGIFHPEGAFAYALSVGARRISQFRVDAMRGLLANNPAQLTAMSWGPRHAAFGAGGKHVYVVNERPLSVVACKVNAGNGTLASMQEQPTLPPEIAPHDDVSGAEIAVGPSGRFLYLSLRDVREPPAMRVANLIAVFAIDQATGHLTAVGHQPSGGHTPRGFAIDPTGKVLFVLNQDSGSLVSFRIDGERGTLTPIGELANVGQFPIGIALFRPMP